MLSDKAKTFLEQQPVLLQTLKGYKFYEHPVGGEDVPQICITPCGKLYRTPFWDRITEDDLTYIVNYWRETKKTFKG